MKVSVALCTYNGERYIRQQMDSLFAQTKLPDEIIICDDCSGDRTLEIVSEYVDRGVEVQIHKNESNLGFVKNFRQCISLCTGDLIFLCDQDDMWKNDKVKALCCLMEAKPEILSVCTNFRLMDSDGVFFTEDPAGDNMFFNKKTWEISRQEDSLYKIKFSAILSHNIAPGCTQAVRRSIISDYLEWDFDEAHDYVLNILAAAKEGLYYYDAPLTYYRSHYRQTIGAPYYRIAKARKEYAVMAESYLNIFRVFIYQVILKRYDKVGPPSIYGYRTQLAYFDAMTLSEETQKDYQFWRQMAVNRTALYSPGPGRLKYFVRQRKYNKHFIYNYGRIEKLQMRMFDLTALLVLKNP